MSKTTIPTGGITADAIDATKIADDAISEEHLDATAITGHTALAATPADTDELIISDAGTLKRIDFSHLKSGGMVLTGSGSTSSNVSNVSVANCFNSTYRQYLLIFDMTPSSNGENPRIQFQDGSGSNINSSSYGYAFSGQDFSGGSENTVANNNDTAFQPGQGTKNQSNTDYPATSGVLHIINPFSSSNNVNFMGTLLNRGNNGEDRAYAGAGRLNVQTQCTGLTFFFGGGNVNNATIKVYGIVDS